MEPRTALAVIPIAKPCPLTWESLRGDDRVRFCDVCRTHVHNLSAMTSAEAGKFVTEAKHLPCITYQQTTDGRIRTLDYQSPTRSPWPRRWRRIVALAAVLAGCV